MHIKEEHFSGSEIVDKFIRQRDGDRRAGFSSNILRITGGEPFLAPQLLIDVLEELRNRGLDREIFLWTETNLVPLIMENDSDTLVPDDLLGKLGSYHNFCIHPCFHGLDETNFQEITNEEIGDFGILVRAFERLVDAQIDVYPTFGSNTSSPKLVETFYNSISKIDRLLPLRFCLIEYDLDYKPVRWRRDEIPEFVDMHERIYDRFQLIEMWNKLLEKSTGYSYGDIPRHLVPMTSARD